MAVLFLIGTVIHNHKITPKIHCYMFLFNIVLNSSGEAHLQTYDGHSENKL